MQVQIARLDRRAGAHCPRPGGQQERSRETFPCIAWRASSTSPPDRQALPNRVSKLRLPFFPIVCVCSDSFRLFSRLFFPIVFPDCFSDCFSSGSFRTVLAGWPPSLCTSTNPIHPPAHRRPLATRTRAGRRRTHRPDRVSVTERTTSQSHTTPQCTKTIRSSFFLLFLSK